MGKLQLDDYDVAYTIHQFSSGGIRIKYWECGKKDEHSTGRMGVIDISQDLVKALREYLKVEVTEIKEICPYCGSNPNNIKEEVIKE